MSFFRTYGKSLIAAAVAVVTVILSADSQNHVNPAEWIRIAIAATTAAAVYLAPVTHDYRWVKTAIAVLLSVLNVLVALILDGIQPTDWIAVALAAATALGVGVAPAVSETRPPTPAQP